VGGFLATANLFSSLFAGIGDFNSYFCARTIRQPSLGVNLRLFRSRLGSNRTSFGHSAEGLGLFFASPPALPTALYKMASERSLRCLGQAGLAAERRYKKR